MKLFRLIEWLTLLSMGMVAALGNGVSHNRKWPNTKTSHFFDPDCSSQKPGYMNKTARAKRGEKRAICSCCDREPVCIVSILSGTGPCCITGQKRSRLREEIYRKIQTELDTCTAYIEYRIRQNHLLIIVVKRHNCFIRSKALDRRFPASVRLYRTLLQQHTLIKKKKQQRFFQTSHYLYRVLIEPVSDHILSCNRLAIVAGDELSQLAFETFVTSYDSAATFSTAAWLVRRYSIQYHYDAERIIGAEPRSTDYQYDFSGYAPMTDKNTKPEKGFPPQTGHSRREYRLSNHAGRHVPVLSLSSSRREVSAIVDAFRRNGLKAEGHYGNGATKKRFKRQAGSRVLHMATHGVYLPGRPGLNGLMFYSRKANPRRYLLSPAEILRLDLNCDLLVLACCESGVKKWNYHRDKISLAACFIHSGTPNVICTLWPINDRHSSFFMLQFYRALLAGDSYVQALRRAKLKSLENKTAALPCHWASFLLIGKL
ncbi:CHAT domain-containing protein [candidate division KSB1 bacterium]|nr:CHAT domain-containing protein [candidate division KSB1 bacterium]